MNSTHTSPAIESYHHHTTKAPLGLSPLGSSITHKRKWDDILIDEKQELEQHALILASLCSKPPDGSTAAQPQQHSPPHSSSSFSSAGSIPTTTITPAVPPLHFTPPLSEDYDDLRVSHMSSNSSKSDPKKRIRTTPEQLRVLEKTYERETNPSQSLREDIARKLGMTPRRVQVWFQNKRAKERRITKSMNEQPGLGSSPSSSQTHNSDLLMPIIETVPKIITPTSSPQSSPLRNSSMNAGGSSPGQSPDSSSVTSSPPPGMGYEPTAQNSPPYGLPPPQVQSFSVPEGMVGSHPRRAQTASSREGGQTSNTPPQGRPMLHLPFPGERGTSSNPFPGPGSSKENNNNNNNNNNMRDGDWKLPPLREILY